MYYYKQNKSEPVLALQVGAIYSFCFECGDYRYYEYYEAQNNPSLITVTETEWNEKKPVIPEPEEVVPITQLDRLEASLDYLVMLNI